MPIRMGWMVENQVVYVELIPPVTEEEIKASQQDGIKLFDQASGSFIHSIYDMTKIEKPLGIGLLAKAVVLKRPRVGYSVTVGAPNSAVKFVGSVVTQIFRLRARFVDTLPEAEEFLRDLYPEIPPFKKSSDIIWLHVYGGTEQPQ